MTGRAALDLLGRLNGRAPGDAGRRRLLDRFVLGDAELARPLREYSSGMKRKLGIVQAFQHDPPLVILDEPSEGEVEKLWIEEARRRLTAYRAGQVEAIPAEEVFRRAVADLE